MSGGRLRLRRMGECCIYGAWSNGPNERRSRELKCTPQFSSALFFFDAATVHLAVAASTVFVLYGFYAFAGQHIGTLVLQSIVLQVSPFVFSTCLAVTSSVIASRGFPRKSRVIKSFNIVTTRLALRYLHKCMQRFRHP